MVLSRSQRWWGLNLNSTDSKTIFPTLRNGLGNFLFPGNFNFRGPIFSRLPELGSRKSRGSIATASSDILSRVFDPTSELGSAENENGKPVN